MNLSIVGTGYVGLVTGALFAERGNNVICVDKDQKIVDKLNSGKIHIFEPGLEEIVKESERRGNLSFTKNIKNSVLKSDIIFLAVGTPVGKNGEFDLRYIKKASADIGKALKDQTGYKIVVGKSTVPQGTYKIIQEIINREVAGNNLLEWDYVSNPETLAEGSAVKDFSSPNRILIGTYSDRAFEVMKELYHPFNIRNNRIMRGTPAEAEFAKLGANTLLALNIAAIDELAMIADHTEGVDMENARKMICSDSRIGYSFRFPGPGFGGSCFPKDAQGLVQQATLDGYSPMILSQIHASNEAHKLSLAYKVIKFLKEEKPTIAVWGLTFKPNTDDMRNAASIPIITHLVNKKGAEIKAYDPQDRQARKIFKGSDRITLVKNRFDAAEGADALILMTEWKEFDAPDFAKLQEIMRGNKVFDFRNRWLPESANEKGFDYFGVGRNHPLCKYKSR